MRLLLKARAFMRPAGAFLLMMLLMIFTPLVAAAASLEAVPHMGPGGIFATVAAAGLGLGAVITLKAGQAEKRKAFSVPATDGKEGEALEQIEQFAELRAEERTGPLGTEVARLKAENTLLRAAIGGEIIRQRQLTAPKDKEGKTTFDVAGETEYLLGSEEKGITPLSADRLVMEFKRLPGAETIKLRPVTNGDAPEDSGDPDEKLFA